MRICCYLKKYKSTRQSFGIPPACMCFQTLNCSNFELKLLHVCYSELKKLYKQTICRQILLPEYPVSVPARGKNTFTALCTYALDLILCQDQRCWFCKMYLPVEICTRYISVSLCRYLSLEHQRIKKLGLKSIIQKLKLPEQVNSM